MKPVPPSITTTVSIPGSFSILTCATSLSGLLLLLYVLQFRPLIIPPGFVSSQWWDIGLLSSGCLLTVGLLYCAISWWRQEAESWAKSFGLFLNLVATVLIGAVVVVQL